MKWLRYQRVISLKIQVGITNQRNKWANTDIRISPVDWSHPPCTQFHDHKCGVILYGRCNDITYHSLHLRSSFLIQFVKLSLSRQEDLTSYIKGVTFWQMHLTSWHNHHHNDLSLVYNVDGLFCQFVRQLFQLVMKMSICQIIWEVYIN
jgi:hypothetical protein